MKLNLDAKYNRLLLNALAFVTVLTLLFAFFSHLSLTEELMNIFFCSDTLYLPSVYRDLVIDKNPVSGWEFNPAPNFFPDMLFYFILMFVTNGNFIIASFVFSIIQYVLIGFLIVKLLKFIFPSASAYYDLLIYALFSFFILEFFFFSRDIFFVFFIIVNSYHAGAFIMTFVCLYLSFKYIKDHKIMRPILILISGFLMMLSDKLFIVFYVVPICLSCVFLHKKTGIKAALVLVGTCVLFVITGSIVFEKIHVDSYDLLGKTSGKLAESSVIKQQFLFFFEQIGSYLKQFGIRTLGICLFLLTFPAMIYVFFHALKRSNNIFISFYALFSIIFSLCVICAPMLVGKYEGVDCLRYNIYPVYLAVLNLAVFFAYGVKRANILRTGRLVIPCFSLFVLAIGLLQLRPTGLKEFFSYYPENARLVDEVAEKEDLKYGVANYWDAKKITMFSKKGVKVYAVFDDIAFYLHVANNRWFFDNMFNFVILNRFNDTTIYKTKLKDITYLSNTPQLRLVRTRPFYYNRAVGGAAINTEIKENENDKQGSKKR